MRFTQPNPLVVKFPKVLNFIHLLTSIQLNVFKFSHQAIKFKLKNLSFVFLKCLKEVRVFVFSRDHLSIVDFLLLRTLCHLFKWIYLSFLIIIQGQPSIELEKIMIFMVMFTLNALCFHENFYLYTKFQVLLVYMH